MILEVSCAKSTVIPNLHALFAQECLLPSKSFNSSWLVCGGDEATVRVSTTDMMLTPRFHTVQALFGSIAPLIYI